MSLTANVLYRDTISFFRQHSKTLLLIALFSAFVTVLLSYLFLPASDQLQQLLATGNKDDSLLEVIKNMDPDQQRVLMHSSAIMTFSALIGNALLIGGVLRLLPAVANGNSISALAAMASSINVFPRLLIQTFLITLITQLGFLVFIIPGIILLMLFSLSPVLLLQQDKGLLRTMKQSVTLVWANFRLVAPAVLAWLLVKAALSLMIGSIATLSSSLIALLGTTLSNLVAALLVIYLYRLYQSIR